MEFVFVLLAGAGAGCVACLCVVRMIRRRGAQASPPQVHIIADRVRSVSRLVGLEVCAKEIATVSKGISWLPPALLSQARLAMIFQFEKQYFVDLARIGPDDIDALAPGRYRLRLPPIEGALRLIDITPYDIQDGRILGLLDVIPMNARTQKDLMDRAQIEAEHLFEQSDARYCAEARSAIERQLESLLALFDCEIEIAWPENPARHSAADGLSIEVVDAPVPMAASS